MIIYLRCLEGPQKGRELLVDPQSPLQFELKRKGVPCGLVGFIATETAVRFLNESEVESAVNDSDCRDAQLAHGDLVRIGPLIFQAQLLNEDETRPGRPPSSAIAAQLAEQPAAQPLRQQEPQEPQDHSAGEPITEASPQLPPQAAENGPAPTPAEPRNARRISVSRMSSVDDGTEDAKSILSRVGSVFRRSRPPADHGELAALEERRARLLTEVGRNSLTQGGGFGLNPQLFAQILAGQTAEVGPGGIDQQELDVFKRNSELLRYLDAEIIAKRRECGLDPKARRLSSPMPLREEREEREASAYSAMDAMGTESLGTGTGTTPIEIDEDYEDARKAGTPDLPAPAQAASKKIPTDRLSAPSQGKPPGQAAAAASARARRMSSGGAASRDKAPEKKDADNKTSGSGSASAGQPGGSQRRRARRRRR